MAQTEWVEEKEGQELLEAIANDFKCNCEQQGFSRIEAAMLFIEQELTTHDAAKLAQAMIPWLVDAVRSEERIGRD